MRRRPKWRISTRTPSRDCRRSATSERDARPRYEPHPPNALADPKDRLDVFIDVQRAGELMVKDEYAPAAEALESALRKEPSMPQARLMLGSCYWELGRNAGRESAIRQRAEGRSAECAGAHRDGERPASRKDGPRTS